jgi:hypothetical protein
VHPDKLLYEFEHDVFPLCHCATVSWRTFAGCFTDGRIADAKLSASKVEIRHDAPDLKLPLATPRALRAGGPSNCEPIALRVTVIGGDRLGDDDEVISRGLPIFRIMKATGRCPRAATAEP